jgi:hypothetical protein
VVRVRHLLADGVSPDALAAQVAARRWRRFGRAVLLHNGEPSPGERRRLALANAGGRAALAAFTAAEELGLRGWERDVVHVLVPGGTRVRRLPGIPTRVHYTGTWDDVPLMRDRRVQRLAPAVILAASTFAGPRPAVGIVAAAVQQRLATVGQLRTAVAAAPRARHRRALLLAIGDLGMGAQALSEIDFARLCRRAGLPEPVRQAVRPDRFGRRRYLDAEWITRSGRRLVVEVDGALHSWCRRGGPTNSGRTSWCWPTTPCSGCRARWSGSRRRSWWTSCAAGSRSDADREVILCAFAAYDPRIGTSMSRAKDQPMSAYVRAWPGALPGRVGTPVPCARVIRYGIF